jgi:thiamine-phosphate pyrophosphorylase
VTARATPDWPRLVTITDCSVAPIAQWLERLTRLSALARPGSFAVLLRDHHLAARERLAFGRTLRSLTREHAQELWVADRLDLALLLDAEGLHLGEGSVPASSARPFWSRRVTRAWHAPSLDDATTPELSGVDALLLSPIMAPRKGRAPLGAAALGVLGEQLRARNSASPLPIYALGGVTAGSAPGCLAAGAWGAAVIGAALTDDPAALVAALRVARSS